MIPQQPRPERVYNWSQKIIQRDNVLTQSMCQSLVSWACEPGSGLHRGIPKHDWWQSSFSTTQLPLHHEIHEHLQSVWQELHAHYEFDLDFVEEYEIKCYKAGDFFDKHTDCSYSLKNGLERKLTVSINLSAPDSYAGGKFTVMGREIEQTQGTLTAFPTFFQHQIYPVTAGERWVLVGWAWGPYWR